MSLADTFVKIRKPTKQTKYQATKQFIHNSEHGTFCGRTLYEWPKRILFYLLFYIVLSILFTICMYTFFLTIDMYIPKWQLEESLIGVNPSLGVRPTTIYSEINTISYDQVNENTARYYVESLDEFLQVYKHPHLTPGRQQNLVKCSYDFPPKVGQVCDININEWHPCTDKFYYGYMNGKTTPCVFLKLNKIYGWVPDYYNNSDDLPDEMPYTLQNYIKITRDQRRNTVWVSCNGVNIDDENNIGSIEYYPQWGFPSYFYPYTNADGYLSPLVAVRFTGLVPNVVINVECRAWAKNIIYNKYDKIYPIRLQFFIR